MKHIVTSALLSMIASSAFANDLDVRLGHADDQQITINWTTKETHSSMCSMKVLALNLLAAKYDWNGPAAAGKISLDAAYDGTSMCLHAFGPHRGSLVLNRGAGLPRLADGEYELAINGESYGTLLVGQTVELQASDDQDETGFVTLEGRVETGIVAIGGETTGVVLHSKTHGRVELELGAFAGQDLNGKFVRVSGSLEEVQGIEIALRRVLMVDELEVLAN